MNDLNWKQIWNKRSHISETILNLESLIKLDGFDSGVGRISTEDWQAYARVIAEKIKLFDGASVYELGCGAGAFIYALSAIKTLKVGGLDYASSLIEAAQKAMPNGDFVADDAINMCIDPQYDFVISNSVFHYFSEAYAEKVLKQMIEKSNSAVAILDVPDLQTKTQSELIRRDALTIAEYEKKYAGLSHTYFARDWFEKQAQQLGCKCAIFDGCVPNYGQNQYRFSVLITKAKN